MAKVIYNNIIPFKGFKAINICGLIFVRKDCTPMSATDINHEEIHTAQMKDYWYIGFYIIYLAQWLINLFIYGNVNNAAYYNITFEKEAYVNQYNLDYLKTRKKYSDRNY